MTSFTALCILALAAVAAALVDGAAQPMTGEPRVVPQNRPDVARAARFAVSNFNEANIDDIYAYKILNITSAKIQVRFKTCVYMVIMNILQLKLYIPDRSCGTTVIL